MSTIHLPMPVLSEEDIDRWESTPRIWYDGHEVVGLAERNRGRGYAAFQVKTEDGWHVYQSGRIAWWIGHGEDPGELTVEHTCAVRDCVALGHLELLTRVENVMAASSNCMGAINARKTECIRGHAFDPENTRITADSKGRPRRVCKTCERDRHRKRRQRRQQVVT